MKSKPTIIDGIDIDRKYTIQEVTELYTRGRLGSVGAAGYIVRANWDGTLSFVPATDGTLHNMGFVRDPEMDVGGQEGFRGVGGRVYQDDGTLAEQMRRDVEREHPMIRRTVNQKKAAMVKRLLGAAQLYGTIPGLTDEQISSLIGEPWKTGISVVTGEMLDRVSAHLLGVGEVENKKADSKRIVREHVLA